MFNSLLNVIKWIIFHLFYNLFLNVGSYHHKRKENSLVPLIRMDIQARTKAQQDDLLGIKYIMKWRRLVNYYKVCVYFLDIIFFVFSRERVHLKNNKNGYNKVGFC